MTTTAGAPASDALRTDAPRLADSVQLVGEPRRSGYRRPPRLVRRGDGQTITLSPLLYLTARALRDESDVDRVAERVSAEYGRRVTSDDVRLLCEAKLRPLGLLEEPDGTDPEVHRRNPLLALTLRVVLSNPRVTGRLAGLFSWMFHPLVVLPAVIAFVSVSLWLFLARGLAGAAHQAFYEPQTLLLIWGVTVGSAAFHELGHAAACKYGGARPGVMGAGLYLAWPAFYTDVSDAYRLGLAGRLRVDLGGLYFNAVFALGTVVAWWFSGMEALLLVILAQHLQMLRQLAPFIRADGYHLVADAIGVPDLFAHIRPVLWSVVPRRWGGRRHDVLKTWARVVVTTWVVVVVPLLLVMLALAVHTLPRLAATAWDSIGIQRHVATEAWGRADFAAALVSAVYILVVATPVIAILILLYRVSTRTARRAWVATRGRPVSRAIAVTAGVAVLCATAWSWWPGDQYRPITDNVRAQSGTVLYPLRAQERYVVNGVANPVMAFRSAAAPLMPVPSALSPRPITTFSLVHEPGEPPTGGTASYGVVTEPGKPTWVFPFAPPPPPGPGDNQALSVNVTDNTLQTAMAVAWAVSQGGTEDVVDNRNEAHAYASCDHCAALAAAFQVLLLVDSPVVVVPVNLAAAASYHCDRCATAAIAVQLVVSLTGMPSAHATELIDQAMDQVAQLESQLGEMSVEQVYAALTMTEEQVMQVLVDDGVAPELVQQSATSSTQSPTATPTDAVTTGATTTTDGPTPTPTPTDQPSASVSDSPSATTGPTSGPSSEPTTTPDTSSASPTTATDSSSATPTP